MHLKGTIGLGGLRLRAVRCSGEEALGTETTQLMSPQLCLLPGQEVINIFGSMSGWRQSQRWSYLEVRNRPLLLFLPAPQDTGSYDDQDDGQEHDKAREDDLAFLSLQAAKSPLPSAGL